jgi:hypothetical protein
VSMRRRRASERRSGRTNCGSLSPPKVKKTSEIGSDLLTMLQGAREAESADECSASVEAGARSTHAAEAV